MIWFQTNAQTNAIAAKVDFKIKNAGITVDGTFDSIQAQLNLPKTKWNNATLTGKVYGKSIKTGIGLRDKHLINDDYFDVETFPWITLTSLSLDEIKKGEVLGEFNLSIKDITKQVSIPLIYSTSGNNVIVKGEFVINRLDFGIGEESMVLSDEVRILFEATFPK